MGMQTTGRIHSIFEAKQVTERFRKREFVVELSDNPRYPQFVLFQLTVDIRLDVSHHAPGFAHPQPCRSGETRQAIGTDHQKRYDTNQRQLPKANIKHRGSEIAASSLRVARQ